MKDFFYFSKTIKYYQNRKLHAYYTEWDKLQKKWSAK